MTRKVIVINIFKKIDDHVENFTMELESISNEKRIVTQLGECYKISEHCFNKDRVVDVD